MDKSKRKSQRAAFLRRQREDKQEARFSLDINTGVEKLRPEDLLQRETPNTVRDAFVNGRKWHKENWFVELICYLKAGYFNFGLEILPESKKDEKKLEAHQKDKRKNAELNRYIESVIGEFILQDTVVSFWREEANMSPYVLLPENCRYSDAMGIEKMHVFFEYTKQDLEDNSDSLSPEMIKRYSGRREVLLDEERDEYFQVLTRGLRGYGFGWPRLRTVTRTLSQNESMEVGESMLALAGRLVERTHRFGFEVKASANAMKQSDYLWKKPRAEAIQNFYTGRSGFVETTRQFDHYTEYIWVDPKYYDTRKWLTIIDRLVWWAGPLGFMIMAKQPNPNMIQIFMTEAQGFRDKAARHMEYVISQGFGLNVKLKWSNQCFIDQRLFWDMAKTLMAQGPLSLTTGLEVGGFDPEREAQRKKDEAKKDRLQELVPLWDPNHNKGGKPGDPGRPNETAK